MRKGPPSEYSDTHNEPGYYSDEYCESLQSAAHFNQNDDSCDNFQDFMA